MRSFKFLFLLIFILFLSCKKEKSSILDILKHGLWVEKNNLIFNRSLQFNKNELLFYKQGVVDTFYYSLNQNNDTLILTRKNSQLQTESRNHFYIENESKLTIYNLSPGPPFQTSKDIFYNE